MENLELFDIPDYEGEYCATKDGRIYSLKSNRILKPGDDTYGYETISLGGKTHKLHKIIAKTFLKNPENLPHIDHINRNRKDNRVCNLRYASYSDNMRNKNPKQTKTPEYRNIEVKKTTFKVRINTKDNVIYRSFKTLKEAQDFRDSFKMKPSQEMQDAP